MGITGVYKVKVQHFGDSFEHELHLIEDKYSTVYGAMKCSVLSCSLFNGKTIISPAEKEAHNFLFHNAQVDDYSRFKLPDGSTVVLSPPGGYHMSEIQFGGTVQGDEIVGCFIFRNALSISVYGHRIEGDAVVNREYRPDTSYGFNRYCTCGTASCSHRGYCDNCQVFEYLHSSMMPPNRLGIPPMPMCMLPKASKYYGVKVEELFEMNAPVVNGEERPAHGPHHLVDDEYNKA